MSQKHEWWEFILKIIRGYPGRCRKLKDLRQQNTTANISGMPRGGEASRTTEGVALRQLSPIEQRRYDSVHSAIQRTKRMREAKIRLAVVRLTLWEADTLDGAAYKLHISRKTAENYRWDFVMMTGVAHEQVTEEEYQAERRKRYKTKSLRSSDQKT